MGYAIFPLFLPCDIMEEGSREQYLHVGILLLPDPLTKVNNPHDMIQPV